MSLNRLNDYLFHMQQTAEDACGFVTGFSRERFLADRRTQRAVIMSLIILGESASKLMDKHTEFTRRHPQIPWNGLRGMRNRIAHGYFDINLEVIWNTLQGALPELTTQLAVIQGDASGGMPHGQSTLPARPVANAALRHHWPMSGQAVNDSS